MIGTKPSDYVCLAVYSELRGYDDYKIESLQDRAFAMGQPVTVIQAIPQLVGLTYHAPKWVDISENNQLNKVEYNEFIRALALAVIQKDI